MQHSISKEEKKERSRGRWKEGRKADDTNTAKWQLLESGYLIHGCQLYSFPQFSYIFKLFPFFHLKMTAYQQRNFTSSAVVPILQELPGFINDQGTSKQILGLMLILISPYPRPRGLSWLLYTCVAFGFCQTTVAPGDRLRGKEGGKHETKAL